MIYETSINESDTLAYFPVAHSSLLLVARDVWLWKAGMQHIPGGLVEATQAFQGKLDS